MKRCLCLLAVVILASIPAGPVLSQRLATTCQPGIAPAVKQVTLERYADGVWATPCDAPFSALIHSKPSP